MPELIIVKYPKLEIITEIAASSSIKCMKFAQLLLRDTAVKRIEKETKGDDDAFVYKVFQDWVSRNDDDKDDPAVPRTWESLVECIEGAGLDGVLVKAVRDRFCPGTVDL